MKKVADLSLLRGVAGALAASLLVLSCTEDEVTPEPPVLVIAEDSVTVGAGGGEAEVSYELENPAEGLELAASAGDAGWIDGFAASDGRLTFTVAPNDSPEAREAEVEVVYGDASDSFRVVQEGKSSQAPEGPGKIEISLLEVTSSSVTCSYVPENKKATYIAMFIDKAYFDSFKDDEAYFQDELSIFESFAEMDGMTLEDFLSGNLMRGDRSSLKFTDLDPDLDYYVYAYGLEPSGTRTSDIYKVLFHTENVGHVDMEFDITVDTEDGVSMTVVPSDDSKGYFMNVYSRQSLEESAFTPGDALQMTISDNITFGEFLGMSVEEVLAGMLSYGTDTKSFEDLVAETEYIGCAAAVDESGKICSEVASKDFVTPGVEPSDNVLELSITNVASDKADYSVTATNDDPYVLVIAPREGWEHMNEAEMVEELLSGIYDLSKNVVSGSISGTSKGLVPSTEYFAIAFGYEAGVATTEPTAEYFTTSESGDPSQLVFGFEVSGIGVREASVTVTAAPENAPYHYNIMEGTPTQDQVKDQVETMVDLYEQYGYSRAEYFSDKLYRGTNTFSYTNLSGGRTYTPYAFGVFEQSGEYATEIVLCEPFTTDEAVVSESVIEVECGKYFDVDALKEAYPGYAGQSGKACMPWSLRTEGSCQKTYVAVLQNDYTSEAVNSDEALIMTLVDFGYGQSGTSGEFMLDYDTDMTVLAVLQDEDGNWSKVFRKLVHCTRDGVSPVDEYVPAGQAPAFDKVEHKEPAPVHYENKFQITKKI